MPAQPLVIHLQREEDAECVARVLAQHRSTADAKVKGWDVHVDIRSRLNDVLLALHECLVENDIRIVHVRIDKRTYAMEPMPGD